MYIYIMVREKICTESLVFSKNIASSKEMRDPLKEMIENDRK